MLLPPNTSPIGKPDRLTLFSRFNLLSPTQQIMSQNSELHSNEQLKNISLAFRKLLNRITSAQVRLNSDRRSIKKGSVSLLHNQQLIRKKRTSLSLGGSRKNSFFSRNVGNIQEGMTKTHGPLQKKWKEGKQVESSRYNSVRCHSNPSPSNCSFLYSKIAEHNQMLITKTYQLEEMPNQSASRNTSIKEYLKKPKPTQQSQEVVCYHSKIRTNENNRRNQNKAKNHLNLRTSLNPFKKNNDFQPWQTSQLQEYYFTDQ